MGEWTVYKSAECLRRADAIARPEVTPAPVDDPIDWTPSWRMIALACAISAVLWAILVIAVLTVF